MRRAVRSPAVFGEVDGFGFLLVEDAVHFGGGGAVLEGGVEGVVGEGDVEEDAHGGLLVGGGERGL